MVRAKNASMVKFESTKTSSVAAISFIDTAKRSHTESNGWYTDYEQVLHEKDGTWKAIIHFVHYS